MEIQETDILLVTRASQMLAEATTILKAKELKDLALAAADYARHKGYDQETIRNAMMYSRLAKDRMGELLVKTERAKGGQPYQAKSTRGGPSQVEPTYKELGIDRHEAANAQRFHELDDDIKQDVIEGRMAEVNAHRVQRQRRAPAEAKKLPSGKYRVIYADPPWSYNDKLAISKTGSGESYGPAETHYPAMSIQQLCDLPVKDLAAPNSVLFMWATAPLLKQCFLVIEAWDFEYKTFFVWDKVHHNLGHYSSVRHEVLMVATRGSCTPDKPKLFDSVVSIERGEHSEKPEQFREIIDTLYPYGPRIELFARKEHLGWQCWGLEASGARLKVWC